MFEKQHTIKAAVELAGFGLHTGAAVTIKFCPAPVDHGYKFKRVDLPTKPLIEATAEYVSDLERGTTLEKDGVKIATVEHALAALVGLQIDNVLIEIDGAEVPILDGSAIEFLLALEGAGLEEQNALRNFFVINQDIHYQDAEHNVELTISPLDDYRLTVMVDYNSPVLGSQYAYLNKLEHFKKEIAPCRTFCFLHEIQDLYEKDLIKGASFNNAIVIVDEVISEAKIQHLAKLLDLKEVKIQKEGVLNNVELHYKNEPARHKLLDILGDLALVGQPIKGQVIASRPGHKSNVAFAKLIQAQAKKQRSKKIHHFNYKAETPVVMDTPAILKLLPHAHPFVLIDKVVHLEAKNIVAVKNVTFNEPFFPGHFPGNPVMPGVLQIEALAQAGAVLLLNNLPAPANYWIYFVGIEKCRFRRKVLPGDTLIMTCYLLGDVRRGLARMSGYIHIGEKLACEVLVTASVVAKDKG